MKEKIEIVRDTRGSYSSLGKSQAASGAHTGDENGAQRNKRQFVEFVRRRYCANESRKSVVCSHHSRADMPHEKQPQPPTGGAFTQLSGLIPTKL